MITKSDLENDYLLNSKQIIILPALIDDDTLEMLMAKFWYLIEKKAENTAIRLYCRCDGGDALAGLAIANLISTVNHVVGILIGDTGSSGATIWASCARRYVHKNAMLGLHPVMWEQNHVKYDAAKLKELSRSFEETDRRQCKIYAAASNKPFEWWWEYYNRAGDVKWLSSAQLVDIGMAEYADM